jgi:hypothetical protein
MSPRATGLRVADSSSNYVPLYWGHGLGSNSLSDIANTSTLWIVYRHSTYLTLAPSSTGTPEPVVPTPVIFRVVYVTEAEAERGDLQSSWNSLHERFANIGVKLPSADGLPAQSLIVFIWRTAGPISYAVNGRAFHGIDASAYGAAVPAQQMVWEGEIHQGRLGYFLIGSARQGNLWRVVRVETDYTSRFVFTILPVTLPNGLPSPRFERIEDDEIRTEVEQHWRDLQNALDHRSHRALVAAAKNVAEGLLYIETRERLGRKRADMGTMLPILRDLLAKKEPATLPFTELDYHLMSKLRLLHQRTHVEHGISRPLRPELALTAAQDLAEVLRSVGLAD